MNQQFNISHTHMHLGIKANGLTLRNIIYLAAEDSEQPSPALHQFLAELDADTLVRLFDNNAPVYFTTIPDRIVEQVGTDPEVLWHTLQPYLLKAGCMGVLIQAFRPIRKYANKSDKSNWKTIPNCWHSHWVYSDHFNSAAQQALVWSTKHLKADAQDLAQYEAVKQA